MDIYTILNINPNTNIIDILKQFQFLCVKNPDNILLYTEALLILSDKNKRIFYDCSLFKIDILDMINYINHYDNYYDIDEYELIPYITWLEIFKDSLYDTKYYYKNNNNVLLEGLYNKLEFISETLKNYIKSLYIA